ncbi:MAG TPA: rRNA adenine N-6-methyltransferase family protein, partial [Gemmatimonadales bacterium]|nr:rRNA adenine N-6-methyltransferase family protein [Gemmatimonadales bacterium]
PPPPGPVLPEGSSERQIVLIVTSLQRSSRSEQFLLFGRNFFKHPKMLGSLIPSSRFLVNHVLAEVDWDRARVFLEYGPGVGTFTTEILRRMRPDAVLVALETNHDFVRFLKRKLRDERLHVVHGSAADADAVLARLKLDRADYVISGIPYTTMPAELREAILRTTHDVLKPDGAFLVYQFTRAVLPYLQQVFGSVHQEFEPLNVMPARLFYCRHHVAHSSTQENGRRARGSGRQMSLQRVAPDPTPSARSPQSSD